MMSDSNGAGRDESNTSSSRADDDAMKQSVQLGARARRTRTALIEAAREVFEADGVKEARVADITGKAGVAYGSFYNYFTSKEEIFREVVREVTGEMFTQTVARGMADGNPVSRIREGNLRYMRSYARNARIMALIEEVAPYDEYCRELLIGIRSMFNQRNEAGIRRLQSRGLVSEELDPHIAAIALGGMIENFGRVTFITGEPYDEDRTVGTLTILWAQALGLPIGQTAKPGQESDSPEAPADAPALPAAGGLSART